VANARKVPQAAIDQADMVELMALPAFKRFLLRVGIASDMWAAASGSEDRHLRMTEGRRSLGFDIFSWADDALSLTHPSSLPIHTMALVLREAQPPGGNNGPAQDDQSEDDAADEDVRRV
jgi:hypothetical protein